MSIWQTSLEKVLFGLLMQLLCLIFRVLAFVSFFFVETFQEYFRLFSFCSHDRVIGENTSSSLPERMWSVHSNNHNIVITFGGCATLLLLLLIYLILQPHVTRCWHQFASLLPSKPRRRGAKIFALKLPLHNPSSRKGNNAWWLAA